MSPSLARLDRLAILRRMPLHNSFAQTATPAAALQCVVIVKAKKPQLI